MKPYRQNAAILSRGHEIILCVDNQGLRNAAEQFCRNCIFHFYYYQERLEEKFSVYRHRTRHKLFLEYVIMFFFRLYSIPVAIDFHVTKDSGGDFAACIKNSKGFWLKRRRTTEQHIDVWLQVDKPP